MVTPVSLILLSFCILGYATYKEDIPLFVWTGQGSNQPHNQQVRGHFTTQNVDNFVQALWHLDAPSDKGLTKYINLNRSAPLELVVIILDSTLSGEELSLHSNLVPTLGRTMKSTHSFYVPCMVEADSPHVRYSTYNAARNSKEYGGELYYLGPADFIGKLERTVDVSAKRVSSFSDIKGNFRDGKTDVLVVNIGGVDSETKLKQTEQRLVELNNVLEGDSITQYVVLFTGLKSSLNEMVPTSAEMGIPEWEKRSILDVLQAPPPPSSDPSKYPQPPKRGFNGFNIYFNGIFWELFTVLLIFFGIVLFGVLTLLQVQAPDRIPVASQKKKI